jgi:hypothetical protein
VVVVEVVATPVGDPPEPVGVAGVEPTANTVPYISARSGVVVSFTVTVAQPAVFTAVWSDTGWKAWAVGLHQNTVCPELMPHTVKLMAEKLLPDDIDTSKYAVPVENAATGSEA